ncbi:MAG: DUF2505 domain-containing protein [Pseudomonadota bacterium]
MSETLEAVHEYARDAATLYAHFTDSEAVKAKHEALGARNVTIVEWSTDDTGATLVFRREVPIEVPGFLKRFLQPWNTVTQREAWRIEDVGLYHADVSVDLLGVPVRIEGTLDIGSTESGCVNDIALSVASSVPLLGAKLADFVAGDSGRLIEAEYRYLSNRFA